MDQDRNVPGKSAGDDGGGGGGAGATSAARGRSVFDAAGCPAATVPADATGPMQDGFAGSLVLQGVEVLDQEQAGAVLSRLDQLGRWVQAQQAKVLHRIEGIFRDEMFFASGKLDPPRSLGFPPGPRRCG